MFEERANPRRARVAAQPAATAAYATIRGIQPSGGCHNGSNLIHSPPAPTTLRCSAYQNAPT